MKWLSDNLIWIGPIVTSAIAAAGVWLWQLAKGSGRAEVVGEQQRAATRALHERLDHMKDRLERLEQKMQTHREVLVREGLLLPGDTQAGTDGRGVKVPKGIR